MNLSCSQTTAAQATLAHAGLAEDFWRHTAVGLGTLDERLCLTGFNPAVERLCGSTADMLEGNNLLNLLLDEDRQPGVMAALKLRGRWQGIVRDSSQPLRMELSRQGSADGRTGYAFSLIDYAEDYRQLRELAAARDLAEKTDKVKSQFLSHMSHELRTPLNAILGFTQLLQMSDDLSPVQQDNLREIENAGGYLLGLINEILDLSRIEAGNLRMSAEALGLEKLIRDCLVLTRPLADRKQVSISIACQISRPLLGDQVRLKQVLLNLLANAVKYNHNGGKVSVHCSDAAAGRLRIEIRDNGPGIRQEQQAGIFSPFARLAAGNPGSDSTGIGLMITRRLVQLMGGRIGLCSEPGRGSVFWIELPSDGATNTALGTAETTSGALLFSIGNDSAWNSLLQRLLPLRPGLRLRVFDNLLDAIAALDEDSPDCVLLSAGMGLPAAQLHGGTVSLKKPALVAVEHAGQTSWNGDASHLHAVLPSGHSLHDILTLIDSLTTLQDRAST